MSKGLEARNQEELATENQYLSQLPLPHLQSLVPTPMP